MISTEINNETIENHLNSLFTPQIRSRGLQLASDGMVQEAYIHAETGHIHSIVKGSVVYVQEIIINEKNRFLSSASCSCPHRNNCKHSAAVLYYMLHHKLDIVKQNQESQGALGKGSDTFRFFPPNVDLNKALDEYSYTNQDVYISKSTIKLNPDNTIQILGYETKYYISGEPKLVADVIFTTENAALGLKCNTCKSATVKLCKHQKATMLELITKVNTNDYISGKLNYQTELTTGAAYFNIPPQAFQESFIITIDHKRALYQKTNEALLEGEEVTKLMQSIVKAKQPLNAKRLGELEESEVQTNAFLWDMSMEDNIGFALLRGKVSKNGDKITVKPDVVQHPEHLNAQGLQVFLALVTMKPTFLAGRNDAYAKTRDYILDNLSEVNKLIHYADEELLLPEVSRSSIRLIQFDSKLITLDIEVSSHPLGYRIGFEVSLDNKIPLDLHKAVFGPLFVSMRGNAFFYENFKEALILKELAGRKELLFTKQDQESFDSFIIELQKLSHIKINPNMVVKKIRKEGGQMNIYLKEVGSFIIFEPMIAFDDVIFNALTQRSMYVLGKNYVIDDEECNVFLNILRELHPKFNINFFFQDYLYLTIEEVLDDLWFINFYERCREEGIHIYGQESFNKLNLSPHRGKISHYVKSGIDWFGMDIELTFGDQLVGTQDWIKAIKENQKYVQLSDGTLGLIPEEWLSKLRKIVQAGEVVDGELKLSKFKFNIIDELFDNIDDSTIIEEIRDKKRRLFDYEQRNDFILPAEIKAELRPYQLSGYQWLRTLDEIKWGGILADDMGLGKTLQIISLLTEVHKIAPNPTLVVLPKTLIFNWCNELDKFSPSLSYMVHYGSDRAVDKDAFAAFDIIITTYTLIVNDIEELKDIQFEYVILDESQAIKNITSQRYKAVCLLKANNKLCMTGTPIENNTFELYAQMNFANPGIFGGVKSFKDQFAVPIDSHADEASAHLLKKMIHPFVMRRTKELVAKDLPEKTETIIYCEMTKSQRKLYDEVKTQIKMELNKRIESDGINSSRFFVLEGLLRLRQICNSPELINSNLPESQRESIKIETLMEALTEELNDHNALVFSQFTSMLALIRRELDKKGIKYSYLDGSTNKRKEVVEEFFENEDIHIFLISLKAGNTGLNLVKADYVYIVDPWWNPAVEAQAIDRTHRIGQDKNIFAYKLVCKDSIEEKILKLQEKKKKVANDIISTDESILKSLDKNEILALFD